MGSRPLRLIRYMGGVSNHKHKNWKKAATAPGLASAEFPPSGALGLRRCQLQRFAGLIEIGLAHEQKTRQAKGHTN